MKNLVVYILLYCFLVTLPGFCQQIGKASRFTSISSSDGLPNNAINAIAQDGDGFYWFATEEGLCRFDGSKNTIYKNNPNDNRSLPHNRVFDLATDAQGSLWVATSFGLAVFNADHNNFYRLNKKNGFKAIPNEYIIAVEALDNDIWFSTPSAICNYNSKTKHLKVVQVPSSSMSKNPYIHSMHLDKHGKLWICIDGYLYNYDPITNRFSEITAYKTILQTTQNQKIACYLSDNDGLWFATDYGNVYHYSFSSLQIKQITVESKTKPTGITALFFDKLGTLNIVIDKKGIGLLNKNRNCISLIENSYFNLIDNCSILCAFMDKQQNIWFGHKKAGVSYISNRSTFEIINSHFDQGTYFKSNTISAILHDRNKNIWIGTDGGGLYKKAPNGYFIPQTLIPSDCILSLYEDSKKNIWVGTYQDGIFFMNEAGMIIKHVTKSDKNGLPSNDIRAITEDKQGVMWFSTHSAGVTSYNPKTNIWRNYSSKNKSGIAGDWTFDILCAKNGTIWVSSNYGLYSIGLDRNTVKGYLSQHTKNSLSNNNVYCLMEDSQNRIWCGTQEGMSCVDPKSGKIFSLLTEEEISVNTLQEDKQGFIWAGTSAGLYKCNLNGQIIQHFNRNTDLSTDCFVARAKDENDETFYLGTTNGMVFFNPLNIDKQANSAMLRFTDIKINNTSIFSEVFENKHFKLNTDTTLRLPYYQNTISISFADLMWINTNYGELYYKLESYDSIPKASPTSRQIDFNNLKPGTYRFTVGYLQNGKYSAQLPITIIIEREWWLRWWAFILYVVLGGLLFWLFGKYIKLTTNAKNQILMEQNKTRQLEELYEAKIHFFTNISHDIRNPLTLIANPVNTLLGKKDLDGESRTLLTIMKRNTNQLLQLVNELLEFKKIEAGVVKLSLRPCNIAQFARQITDDFHNQAFQQNITLQCVVQSEHLSANIEPRYFEKAIYNLLSNAFKFTPEKGTITVHIFEHTVSERQKHYFKRNTVEKKYIAIEVYNSGNEIPEHIIDKIFERFYEGENKSGQQSSGIGLSIVKSIVEQHGGYVTVENRNGAVFTIYIPKSEQTSSAETIFEHYDTLNEPYIEQETATVLKSQTVLIIEDNDDLRTYLEMLLRKHYSTIKASNGREGFELALSVNPDLILSDVMMPDMNGLDLCEKVKTSLETSHIPVILLTARSFEHAEREGLQAGADDYITKPFADDVLLLKISNILKTREQLRSRFSTENKDISEIASTSADAQFMTKFMAMVEKEYTDCDLSVEKIGETIGLSRSQLYKKCLALTGKSPVDIVQEIRMQNALNLLKNTKLTVSEIAYSVGYSDPRYFSNRFKKMIGTTPSDIRDMQG